MGVLIAASISYPWTKGVRNLLRYKCKKSVFCILFLIYFFLGTICGVILFHCLLGTHSPWIPAYCEALGNLEHPGVVTLLFFWCRPLALAVLLGLSPLGSRLVPLLILARGCLSAYLTSFYYASGLSPLSAVLRWLILLPVFYMLCRWAYYASDVSAGAARRSNCMA